MAKQEKDGFFEWEYGGMMERSIIEGIGMETGLFQDLFQFEWNSTLWCAQKDGEQLYGNQCYGWVGQNETPNSSIQIYPNPAVDFVRITIPEIASSSQVKIIDLSGQLIFQEEFNSSNPVINISNLKNGYVHNFCPFRRKDVAKEITDRIVPYYYPPNSASL